MKGKNYSIANVLLVSTILSNVPLPVRMLSSLMRYKPTPPSTCSVHFSICPAILRLMIGEPTYLLSPDVLKISTTATTTTTSIKHIYHIGNAFPFDITRTRVSRARRQKKSSQSDLAPYQHRHLRLRCLARLKKKY